MEIEITKEKETPLLSRKRVTAFAHYEGSTPSRLKIMKEVAKALKADENLVILRHIYTRFGQHRAKLIIHTYSDEQTMLRLEGAELVAKHRPKAEKKEGA